jgi:hypothetical protein
MLLALSQTYRKRYALHEDLLPAGGQVRGEDGDDDA